MAHLINRKLFKFLIWSTLLFVMLGFLFVVYLKSDWNKAFNQQQLSQLKSQIRKAEPLTIKFIEIFDELYATTNTNGILFDATTTNRKRICPCVQLASIVSINKNNRYFANRYVLSWKLEKDFTQKQCFSYFVQNYYFGHGQHGIFEASEYYFHKELNELEFQEMKTLALMLKNPVLYNPRRDSKLDENNSNIKN